MLTTHRIDLTPKFVHSGKTILTKERGRTMSHSELTKRIRRRKVRSGDTPTTATDFNKFRQKSTPLLPKRIKRFIEAY
jgi:hypothetical protein